MRHRQALKVLFEAISQARDEGENIPEWLDAAEDRAIDIINGKEDVDP